MIYIPVQYLRAGMILDRDLPSESRFFALIATGQELTDAIIAGLSDRGIQGAYIRSHFTEDIDMPEFIDPKYKLEILDDMKGICEDYRSSDVMPEHMYRSVSSLAMDIVSYLLSKDELIMNVIDIRSYDNYTYSHSMFVGMLATLIGANMEYPTSRLHELAMAGLLHDMGKLDIPDSIVKKPLRLTEDEYLQMQAHPINAVIRLQKHTSFSPDVISGVESHHERYDGSGYPYGMSGDMIPVFGRILALADVFDALTSNRLYRDAWPADKVIEYMMSNAGTHFDPELLDVFLNVVTAYPVGTVLRLSNGMLAIVLANTPGQTLRPKIRVLSPPDREGEEIDLAEDRRHLNVTVLGTLDSSTDLPDSLFR